ncbi:MAG: hypothetical protein D6699_06315, partial [Aquificota bacterium]
YESKRSESKEGKGKMPATLGRLQDKRGFSLPPFWTQKFANHAQPYGCFLGLSPKKEKEKMPAALKAALKRPRRGRWFTACYTRIISV